MERKQTHLKYGLVTGLATVVVNFIIYHFGFDAVSGITLVAYLPLLVGILLNARTYSAANDARITYAQVFGSCFKVTLIVTLITAVYIIICIINFPSMKDRYLELAHNNMVKNPQVTDEMIARSMELMKKTYVPMMIFFTGIYTLIVGFVSSLIGGTIARKRPEGGMS